MKKLLLLITLVTSLKLSAQSDSGLVVVHKDPRVALLVKKQAQINEETTRSARRNVPGYRIQILNTIDRNAALDAKTKAYRLYPELKAYLIYQAPYYRIRVGNFKTKQEADEYMKDMASNFDNNVFLVRDVVEIKLEGSEP
ncbi:MAG: SPOR domain-containing protein [Williamsia sp.]|nr:SPOR domain-containing protein [Williamsia sp.]